MFPLRQIAVWNRRCYGQISQLQKYHNLNIYGLKTNNFAYSAIGINVQSKGLPYIQIRTQVRKAEEKTGKEIAEAKDQPFSDLSTAQKVKRVGTDATYSVIVIAGIAVTGALFFAIGRELFSGQSSYGIYNKALKRVKNHDDVIVACGEPIKGFAERTRRGRFGRVSHIVYQKDGFKRMRMKFYIDGSDKGGTVNVEAQQNENGKYEFRYIFVELDEDYPKRTILIEDNRNTLSNNSVKPFDI